MSDCNCNSGEPLLNTPENESLPSAVENLTKQFFGIVTKQAGETEGTVEWLLPCNMSDPEPIPGFPREAEEGIGCYIIRYFRANIAGLAGADAFARITANFTQPSLLGTVAVSVDSVDSFAVGQYVWNERGGFYTVTAISPGVVTLRNLFGYSFNLPSGALVAASGTKLLPSGVPQTSGPQGLQGIQGPTGPQGPATEWRNGPGVPDNSLGNNGDYYLRDGVGTVYKKVSGVYVVQTTLTGATGAQGPAGEAPTRFWKFFAPGEHRWVAPISGNVRIRVYGAGGGGGGGGTTPVIGNGAGGGEYADRIYGVTAGQTYSVFVGVGGAGGSGGGSGAFGVDGGPSYVLSGATTVIEALGGKKGGAGLDGAPGDGGTGGAGTAVNRFAGSNGGLGGSAAYGGHAGREGAGGIGGGTNGETPGGGGSGGASGSTTGGTGGNGLVIIEIAV